MADKIYRTVQGDAFDGIAWRLWGNERMAHLLVDANPEYADILIFDPGVALRIPDAKKPVPIAENLPPWIVGG